MIQFRLYDDIYILLKKIVIIINGQAYYDKNVIIYNCQNLYIKYIFATLIQTEIKGTSAGTWINKLASISINQYVSVFAMLFAFIEASCSFVPVHARLLDLNAALGIH